MAYIDTFGLWDNLKVQHRVTLALMAQARAVAVESTGTANYTNRLAYAKFVAANADAQAIAWRYYTLSDAAFAATLLGASTEAQRDAALDAVVVAGWNIFANLHAA